MTMVERHWDISLPGFVNQEEKQTQRQGRRRNTGPHEAHQQRAAAVERDSAK